jgi:hypothetical protein
VCAQLVAKGFDALHVALWSEAEAEVDAALRKKTANKNRYTCPVCGVNAANKPETQFVRSDCDELMIKARTNQC